MKELVEYIATSLADAPDQVKVEESQRGHEVAIRLSLAPDDMGRLIGKQGRVANAMRLLLKVAAAKQGKHAMLEIEERTIP